MLATTMPWVSCLGASFEGFWARAAIRGRAIRAQIATWGSEIFEVLGVNLIQDTPKGCCGLSLQPTGIRRQPTEQGSTAAAPSCVCKQELRLATRISRFIGGAADGIAALD